MQPESDMQEAHARARHYSNKFGEKISSCMTSGLAASMAARSWAVCGRRQAEMVAQAGYDAIYASICIEKRLQVSAFDSGLRRKRFHGESRRLDSPA